MPAIYGNRVVWSLNGDVYMRDISASTQTKIAKGYNPSICDTKITYTYDSGDRPQVYVYDLAARKTIKASSGGDQNNPDCGCDTGFQNEIFGDKIVYSKITNDCMGNAGIYIYNISTGQKDPNI